MRYLFLVIVSSLALPLAAADCIAVNDSKLKELRTEYGMTTVEWQARVVNQCDDSYDATITIRFLDEDGEVLHETLEIMILQRNGSQDTTRNVTLPAERYQKIAETKVEIRERARPG